MSIHRQLPLLLLLMMLHACSTPPPKPVEVEKPVIKVEPKPAPVVKKPVKKKPVRPHVVILVSEAIPAYRQVADELASQLPATTTVMELAAGEKEREQQRKLIQSKAYQQFVAIGLEAAREAGRVAGREDEVVFCQVFNYSQHGIAGPMSKGVGAIPGTRELFQRWSGMSPGLTRVAVVSGEGLEAVIAEAREQAAKQGIELVHRVVKTDKELLFEYKTMAPSVQGLWLLPDNRVLSGRAIRELMSFSVRNGKQVVVFSDELLRLGAVMSVSSRSEEIAAKVKQRLDEAYRVKGFPGPELLLLEQGEISINTIAAKRYNLNVTEN